MKIEIMMRRIYKISAAFLSVAMMLPAPAYSARELATAASPKVRAELRSELSKLGLNTVEGTGYRAQGAGRNLFSRELLPVGRSEVRSVTGMMEDLDPEPVADRVRRIIHAELAKDAPEFLKLFPTPDALREDQDLVSNLGADSLDLVEIMMRIEEKFGIHIGDEQADQLLTVDDFVQFTEEAVAAKQRDASVVQMIRESAQGLADARKLTMTRGHRSATAQFSRSEVRFAPETLWTPMSDQEKTKERKFGTNGVRGDDITAETLQRLTAGSMEILKAKWESEHPGQELPFIEVGFDPRPQGMNGFEPGEISEAKLMAETVAAYGFRVLFVPKPVAAPFFIANTGQGKHPLNIYAAVVRTASHNEVVDPVSGQLVSGIKLFMGNAPAADSLTGKISDQIKASDWIARGLPRFSFDEAVSQGRIVVVKDGDANDPETVEWNRLSSVFDLKSIGAMLKQKFPDIKIALNTMHGGMSNFAVRVLQEMGVPFQAFNTTLMNDAANREKMTGFIEYQDAKGETKRVRFAPDPTRKWMRGAEYQSFVDRLLSSVVSLLIDGDADRLVAEQAGSELVPNDIALIAVKYLWEKGERGRIVRTVPTTSALDDLANALWAGDVSRTDVGSKWFAGPNQYYGGMLEDVMVAAEESGHIVFKYKGQLFFDHSIALALLMLEMMAESGKTWNQLLDEAWGFITERTGAVRRVALRGGISKDEGAPQYYDLVAAMSKLPNDTLRNRFNAALQAELGKKGIQWQVESYDLTAPGGPQLIFQGGRRVMPRKSGTDGSLRLYTELLKTEEGQFGQVVQAMKAALEIVRIEEAATPRSEVRFTREQLQNFRAYPQRFVAVKGQRLWVWLNSLSKPAEPRTFGGVEFPSQVKKEGLRTQEQILELVRNEIIKVIGMQRFADIGGSSIDLRALIKLATDLGINLIDLLPSTTIVAGEFPLSLTAGLSEASGDISAKDVIEYVMQSKDKEGRPTETKYVVVRKEGKLWTRMEDGSLRALIAEADGVYDIWGQKGDARHQKRKKGQVIDGQLGSFAFFMSQIDAFGVKGTFITHQPVTEAGGLGRSGASNAMIIALAGRLAGAPLTKADMNAEALNVEGDGQDESLAILGGYTGGQESGAALLGGLHQMVHLGEVKDESGNYVWPVSTELVIPLAKSLDEVNERVMSHLALVQAGLPFENGKALIKRTAGGINTTWCARGKQLVPGVWDEAGVALHKRKVLVAMIAAYGLMHNKWEFVLWSQNEHRKIRNELDKGFYRIAIQALENDPARPAYADKYLQILKDDPILNKYLQWHIAGKDDHGQLFDLREVSLYSMTSEPLIEEVTRVARELTGRADLELSDEDSPFAVFVPGAGGTGSPAIVMAKSAELLETFFEKATLQNGSGDKKLLREFLEADVLATMGGTGLLQGYLQPKAGKPMEFQGLPEALAKNPDGYQGYVGIYDQETGIYYITEDRKNIPAQVLLLPRVKMLEDYQDIRSAFEAQTRSEVRKSVEGTFYDVPGNEILARVNQAVRRLVTDPKNSGIVKIMLNGTGVYSVQAFKWDDGQLSSPVPEVTAETRRHHQEAAVFPAVLLDASKKVTLIVTQGKNGVPSQINILTGEARSEVRQDILSRARANEARAEVRKTGEWTEEPLIEEMKGIVRAVAGIPMENTELDDLIETTPGNRAIIAGRILNLVNQRGIWTFEKPDLTRESLRTIAQRVLALVRSELRQDPTAATMAADIMNRSQSRAAVSVDQLGAVLRKEALNLADKFHSTVSSLNLPIFIHDHRYHVGLVGLIRDKTTRAWTVTSIPSVNGMNPKLGYRVVGVQGKGSRLSAPYLEIQFVSPRRSEVRADSVAFFSGDKLNDAKAWLRRVMESQEQWPNLAPAWNELVKMVNQPGYQPIGNTDAVLTQFGLLQGNQVPVVIQEIVRAIGYFASANNGRSTAGAKDQIEAYLAASPQEISHSWGTSPAGQFAESIVARSSSRPVTAGEPVVDIWGRSMPQTQTIPATSFAPAAGYPAPATAVTSLEARSELRAVTGVVVTPETWNMIMRVASAKLRETYPTMNFKTVLGSLPEAGWPVFAHKEWAKRLTGLVGYDEAHVAAANRAFVGAVNEVVGNVADWGQPEVYVTKKTDWTEVFGRDVDGIAFQAFDDEVPEQGGTVHLTFAPSRARIIDSLAKTSFFRYQLRYVSTQNREGKTVVTYEIFPDLNYPSRSELRQDIFSPAQVRARDNGARAELRQDGDGVDAGEDSRMRRKGRLPVQRDARGAASLPPEAMARQSGSTNRQASRGIYTPTPADGGAWAGHRVEGIPDQARSEVRQQKSTSPWTMDHRPWTKDGLRITTGEIQMLNLTVPTVSPSEAARLAAMLGLPSLDQPLILGPGMLSKGYAAALRAMMPGAPIVVVAKGTQAKARVRAVNRGLSSGQMPILLASDPAAAVVAARQAAKEAGLRNGTPAGSRSEIRALVLTSDAASITESLRKLLGQANIMIYLEAQMNRMVRAAGSAVEAVVSALRSMYKTARSA